MKLCDSDIFEKSPEKNASLTDWDLLKNEAQVSTFIKQLFIHNPN